MTQITHPTPTTTADPPYSPPPPAVDLLILGAGWTSQFLLPLLTAHRLTYAATTRTGHSSTIPFTFDPDSSSPAPYARLPRAKTVLITFPLQGPGQSERLTSLYARTHPPLRVSSFPSSSSSSSTTTTATPKTTITPTDPDPKTETTTNWILLGSTGIFSAPGWNDSGTPPSAAPSNHRRAVAEDELLSLHGARACVLDLAGLYGGGGEGGEGKGEGGKGKGKGGVRGAPRRPRDWVARSKEEVRGKGALHLVHGRDVARGVVGVAAAAAAAGAGAGGGGFGPVVGGRRWIVTDLRVYDWWDLIMSWGPEGEGVEYRRWVMELMREEGVRALPREKEALGRVLDGRAFWEAIGSWPGEGRVT